MSSYAARFVRRVRFGKSIVIVSGLPRSGTSMAMKMLDAGGVPILSDGLRKADISNPNGYYEFEPVKALDKGGDVAWLGDARGKAVKIISLLLTWLPETYNYQVIFMRRDLGEAVASQDEMLRQRNEPFAQGDSEQMQRAYKAHLEKVTRFLANRDCFSTLMLEHGDAVANPREAASRIAEFLGRPLDVDRMAAVADPTLYRNRRKVEA
jgi:hypothetical protein